MDIDRSIIGRTTPEILFEVEKGRIRQFADTYDDPNPLHRDEEQARKSRHGGMVGQAIFPAAFIVAVGFPLRFDPKRMLHGEEEFIYHRSVRAGDVLRCQARVIDLYEREGQSGTMKFIVVDTDAKDEAGNPVVTCRTTIVYR